MASSTVKITGEPLKAPAKLNMAVTYNASTIWVKVTWAVPSGGTKKDNPNRFQGFQYQFYLDTSLAETKAKSTRVKPKTKKNKKKVKKKGVASTKITGAPAKSQRYKNTGVVRVGTGTTSFSFSIPTSDFYPYNAGRHLDTIVFQVQGYNSKTLKPKKKKARWDSSVPTATAIKTVSIPVAITGEVTDYTKETRTNTIRFQASDDGKSMQMWTRTDFAYQVLKYDASGRLNEIVPRATGSGSTTSMDLVKTYTMDGTGANMIFPGQAIIMELSATARGPKGSAGTYAPSGFLFAYPHPTTINGVAQQGNAVIIDFVLGKTVNDQPIPLHFADGTVQRPLYRTDTIVLQKNQDFMPRQDQIYADDAVWLSAVAKDSGWEDVTSEFSNNIRSFTRPLIADRPSSENPYARTYYRIKTTNMVFGNEGQVEYSEPFVHPIYARVPSAKDEHVEFLELTPESDGTSVRVVVAYTIGEKTDPPSDDDEGSRSDGTEISWSENAFSWKSNQGASTFEIPDKTVWGTNDFRDDEPNWVTDDPEKIAEFKELYEYTSSCYIQGLSEGTEYYFKARRYLEAIGDLPRTYGDYTMYTGGLATTGKGEAPEMVKPVTAPKSVTATVPAAIPVGKTLQVSWTFDSDGTQSSWIVRTYDPDQVTETTDPNQPNRKVYKLVDGAVGSRLKSGNDAFGYTVVPYETLYDEDKEDMVKEQGIRERLDSDNLVYLTVAVAVTGDHTESAPVPVRYVTAPKAYLGLPKTVNEDGYSLVTAQPMTLTLGSNLSTADATVRVRSVDMTTTGMPDGIQSQPSNTVLYSRKIEAEDLAWKEYEGGDFGETVYYSNLKLPSGLPFYDGKLYEVSLTVHDPSNGLDSTLEDPDGILQPMKRTVQADYAIEAVTPDRTVTSVHTTDVDVPDFAAQIWLGKSDTYPEGSVCDIYRVTPDGSTLVCSGVSFGQTVTDIYAPYSNFALTRYRIAVRTPDGNVEWDDFGYNIMPGRTDRPNYPIRFDWGDPETDKSGYHTLEIPYNLNYSDTFKKLFDGRMHFGSKRPTGYWDEGVERTSSFTTDMVKYTSPEEKEAVRALAEYPGPVMVRRPDGCAYVADVQVNNITNDYSALTLSVSFTVTEIDMVQEYMIAEDDELLSASDRAYYEALDEVRESFQDSPLYDLEAQAAAEATEASETEGTDDQEP